MALAQVNFAPHIRRAMHPLSLSSHPLFKFLKVTLTSGKSSTDLVRRTMWDFAYARRAAPQKESLAGTTVQCAVEIRYSSSCSRERGEATAAGRKSEHVLWIISSEA